MKGFPVKALLAALAVHGAILLLGGLLFFRFERDSAVRQDVELVTEERRPDAKKVEPEEKASEQAPIERSDEPIPEMRDLARLEAAVNAPALAPLSLADLEAVLGSDGSSSGGFGIGGGALASGGRIGGTGTGLSLSDGLADIASLADLDQRPRAIVQVPPAYPTELRKRTIEGTVEVVFLVDTEGRVLNPKVEKSTNPAFDQPAVEAVRRWKFEAGTRQGEKVSFKMRVPITFSAG